MTRSTTYIARALLYVPLLALAACSGGSKGRGVQVNPTPTFNVPTLTPTVTPTPTNTPTPSEVPPITPSALHNTGRSFRVATDTSKYLRVRNTGYPDTKAFFEALNLSSNLERSDGTFLLRYGLGANASSTAIKDRYAISFESRRYGGHYLVHEAGRVVLKAFQNTTDFRAKATFVLRTSLGSNGGFISWETYSAPGYYLRRRANGEAWVDFRFANTPEPATYINDASFQMTAPLRP